MNFKYIPHSLGFNLTIFIVVMSLASSVLLTVTGYRIFRQDVEDNFIQSGKNIAKTIVDSLDADTAEVFLDKLEINSDYNDLHNLIKITKSNFGLKYLYVIRFEEDGVHYLFNANDLPVLGDFETWEFFWGNDVSPSIRQKLFSGEEVFIAVSESARYVGTWTILTPLLDKAGNIKNGYYVGCDFAMSDIKAEQDQYFAILFLIALIIAAVFSFVQWVIIRRFVIKPLSTIEQTFTASANMEQPLENNLEIKSKTFEFLGLTAAFNTMRLRLLQQIEDLRNARVEKERIEVELDIARKIQSNIMPFIFPPFPERSDFDLYAEMTPAKKVAGDFYDFFFIDDKHERLALVIADVSGKGMGAAMFMVIVKTLLKAQLLKGEAIEESANIVNRQLCQGNDTNMFVSTWMGIYNTKTGTLDYVNAGHNLPYIRYGIRGQGGFRPLQNSASNVVMGILPDAEYSSQQVVLNKGDILFLYTDGITEAINKDNEIYGEDRLIEKLNQSQDLKTDDILYNIRNSTAEFANGVEQSDDITMLILMKNSDTISGKESGFVKQIVLPADIAAFSTVIEWVDDVLNIVQCSEKYHNDIHLSVEELFVNIVSYAYEYGEGKFIITATLNSTNADESQSKSADSKKTLYIEFADKGVPFNPLEKPDPDLTIPLEDRDVGGLGIFLVKKLMDEVNYSNVDGWNKLTIGKYIEF